MSKEKQKVNVTLAIDSSSSVSGVALFVDKELKEYTEVVHKVDKKMAQEQIDINQNHMQLIIDKLLFKYLFANRETVEIEQFNLVIEQPNIAYTNNNKTTKRLYMYVGLWIGKITALLTAMDNMINKTQLHIYDGNTIWRSFKFDKDKSKIQSVAKVKELYNVDLADYKIPKYNQDGTIKRDRTGQMVYQIGPKHNAADAILLGHIFLNK